MNIFFYVFPNLRPECFAEFQLETEALFFQFKKKKKKSYYTVITPRCLGKNGFR